MNRRLTWLGIVSLLPVAAAGFLFLFAAIANQQTGHWPTFRSSEPRAFSPVFFSLSFIAFVFLVPVATCVALGFQGRKEIGWRPWHTRALAAGCTLFLYQVAQTGQWLTD